MNGILRYGNEWEQIAGEEEQRRGVGLICIALRGREREADEHGGASAETKWQEWLRSQLPEERLRFGDELGGHLWVHAELPDGAAEPTAHLAGIARRLQSALVAGHEGDGGFGVAAVAPASGPAFRDALYTGVLNALAQLRERDQAGGELRREMEKLLRERSIRSVYQPITRLATGEVFGYEALTRCPEGCRFDGPLALFSFAEREGYAFALDRLAREKAIRSSPALNAAQKIFINVTMGIMNDPHFVSGQTVQWLRQKGLHPGQVVLELTERSSIGDFEEAKRILRHYRSQGYEIAIDDAGAGYSSLQSIVELSPDYIKVDKSLVQYADQDEMKKQMLRTFVRFAKRMKIRTVAEGIERPEELRLLRAMGIDFGQGYLLGRPGAYASDPFYDGLPNG